MTTVFAICPPNFEYDDNDYHLAGYSPPSIAFETIEEADAWAEANKVQHPVDYWGDDEDERPKPAHIRPSVVALTVYVKGTAPVPARRW